MRMWLSWLEHDVANVDIAGSNPVIRSKHDDALPDVESSGAFFVTNYLNSTYQAKTAYMG